MRFVSAVVVALSATGAFAGPLTPPSGPITSTNKTLQEVEPRTPLSQTNTPGDSDSLFKITASGSYYLTGNIDLKSTTKCIEVFLGAGQQATIDLNGFTITGIGATRSESAIYIDGVSANVVIRNGNLRNWKNAVEHFTGGSVTLEDVNASGSRLIQFDLRRATVVRCTAEGGGNAGFFVDSGTLTDCTARGNVGTGFTVNTQATIVRGCTASANGSGGFNLGQGVAESCRAEGNSGNGFTNPGAMTNCVSSTNTGDGIGASFTSVIRGCNVIANTGSGMTVGSGSRIEGNTISSNSEHGVDVTGSRTTVIGNTISTNGRGSGSFSGVKVAGTDNTIDGNHITNMTLGGDDHGIQVTGTSNLIVKNVLSLISDFLDIGPSNTSGGEVTNAATATAWANIAF